MKTVDAGILDVLAYFLEKENMGLCRRYHKDINREDQWVKLEYVTHVQTHFNVLIPGVVTIPQDFTLVQTSLLLIPTMANPWDRESYGDGSYPKLVGNKPPIKLKGIETVFVHLKLELPWYWRRRWEQEQRMLEEQEKAKRAAEGDYDTPL